MTEPRGSSGVLRSLVALVAGAALLAACGVSGIKVSGVVTTGPTCPHPGPVASAERSCAMPLADLPLTIVSTEGSDNGQVVAQPVTDVNGAFSVRLEPGSYRINGAGLTGGAAPSPIFFTVRAGSSPPPLSIVYYVTGL